MSSSRFFFGSLFFALSLVATIAATTAKPRLIVLADMGNEPDEEQQMVHLLMYANEVDIEGLVAVTGKYLRKGPRPDLFFKLIEGYDKVVGKLQLHAPGWPTAAHLRSVTVAGQDNYGIADTGAGKSSPGSRLIIAALDRPDPRPLHVVVNAGSNTLAQALIDYRTTHTAEQFTAALARLRVFENGSQDNAGAWICAQFPAINWIRSNYQTYCYGGPSIDGSADNRGKGQELGPNTWEPYAYNGTGQHQWALEHIKGNHGPLGALWPIRQFPNGGVSFLEGGGTVPWLGLVNHGLYDSEHPYWGGWSGRFSRVREVNYWSKHSDIKVDEEKVAPFAVFKEEPDAWTNPETGERFDGIFAPVWRWRRAFFNDFRARMDWCVKPVKEANHNPVAAVNGDTGDAIIQLAVKAGQELIFDATASRDPDGDALAYAWYFYPEAGTYAGKLTLAAADQPQVKWTVPADASGKEIHLILEAQDKNPEVRLFDYRRVVLTVAP